MASPFTPATVPGASGYPLGLTGATSATRYVGGTTTGAPASGTFAVGDFVITQDGALYICTVAGSPGTWSAVSGGGGLGTVLHDETLNSAGTFDVSGISGAYDDLEVRLLARSSAAGQTFDSAALKLNNDASAIYNYDGDQDSSGSIFVAQVGNDTSFDNGTSNPYIANLPAASSPAGAVGEARWWMPAYSGTTFFKPFHAQWSTLLDTSDGNYRVGRVGGQYNSTSAITRVTITTGRGSTFIAGSRLTIIGYAY